MKMKITMRRFLLILIVILSFPLSAFANESIVGDVVWYDHRYYDSNYNPPRTDKDFYSITASANLTITGVYDPSQVNALVTWDTGNQTLNYDAIRWSGGTPYNGYSSTISGWKEAPIPQTSPPPSLDNWESYSYTFSFSGPSIDVSSTQTIQGALRNLPISIPTFGPSGIVSWTPVDPADANYVIRYRLRVQKWAGGDSPSGAFLFDSGNLTVLSYNLFSFPLAPGEYALRLETTEYLATDTDFSDYINRSVYFTKFTKPVPGPGAQAAEITIDKAKLGASCSSNLTDFPLLIRIANDPQLRHKSYGGSVENINGYDIYFKDAMNNQLAHEVELYDGSMGSLRAWVKIPALSISASTVIYMEYGNPGISYPTENQIAVWDSHYKAVYHMNQRPRSDGRIYDSTIYSLDLTPQRSNFDSNRVPARIGYGLKFRGWDYLRSSKTLSLLDGGKFTFETWVKSSSYWGGRQAMVSVQDGNTHGSRTLTSYDNGPIGVQYNYDVPPPTFQIANPQAYNTWVHLVARYDGTKLEGFVNGVETNYVSYPGWGPVTGIVTLGVWRGETGWLNWFLTEGYLDEVRISDDARDSCWIETSYNNQSDPSFFYTVGSVQVPK